MDNSNVRIVRLKNGQDILCNLQISEDKILVNLLEPMLMETVELKELLRGAEEMLEEFEPEVIDEMLQDWEIGLHWTSVTSARLDPEWYTRAALIMAIRGLRGERKPNGIFFPD